MTDRHPGTRRSPIFLSLLAALAVLVTSCSTGTGDSSAPSTTTAGGDGGGAASEPAKERFQDVWIYEDIATVDVDGEIVTLSEELLGFADDTGDDVDLGDGATFTEWAALSPVLLDGDGTPRDDVDAVAGVVRNGDDEAVMVVATPEGADTPPIDHDDQVELDLTVLEDTLAVDDPLVFSTSFAHTWGPDTADAPDTGIGLLTHRIDEGRLRYAATPGGDDVAVTAELGQVFEGSLKGRLGAKPRAVVDGFSTGVAACDPAESGCIGAIWQAVGEGAAATADQLREQLCDGPCDPVAGVGGSGGTGGSGGDTGGDGSGADSDTGPPPGDDCVVTRVGCAPDGSDTTAPPTTSATTPPPTPEPTTPDGSDGPGGGGDGDEGPINDPGLKDGPPINPPGRTYGEPHIETFDGHRYDLQAVGEFVLADSEDWTVQVRFVPVRNAASMTGVVAARMGEHVVVLDPSGTAGIAEEPRVTIDADDVTPEVNGAPVEHDGFTVTFDAGVFQVAHDDFGIVELDTSGYNSAVVIPFDPERRFVGLLGDRDGRVGNDLRLGPDGDVLVHPDAEMIHGEYADAWRITDDDSLFPYGDGESTATFTDRDHPPASAAQAVAESPDLARAETLCTIVGLEPGAGHEECVTDYTLMGTVGWVTAAARGEVAFTAWKAAAVALLTAGDEGGTVHGSYDGVKHGDKKISYADDEAFYLFARDESDADMILAIDGTTAAEKWRLGGVREECRLTLVGDDRIVVVGTADGPLGVDGKSSLTVVDRDSGEVVGSAAFDDAPTHYCLPLQAIGETVVVVNGLDGLWGWDVSDATPTRSWDTTAGGGASGIASTGDSIVVHTRTGSEGASRLVLIDPADGATLDTLDLDGRRGSHGLVAEGDLVVATIDPPQGAADAVGSVVAVDVADGSLQIRWQHEFAKDHDDPDLVSDRAPASVALAGTRGVLHLGDELFAFDTGSGEVLWRQKLDDFRNTSIPVTIVGDRLFETSFGGPVLIAYAMEDGRPLEKLATEDIVAEGGSHREVHGPVVGNRLLVEGNTRDKQLLVTLLDLDTVAPAGR